MYMYGIYHEAMYMHIYIYIYIYIHTYIHTYILSNYYNTKSFDTNNYHNFYHDTFNFRKIENISLSQQTEITNNSIETNTQIEARPEVAPMGPSGWSSAQSGR